MHHSLFSLVERFRLCVLLDKGTANVICKAVQTEEGLEDGVHVASVTQVGEPVWGVSSKEKHTLAHYCAMYIVRV